MPDPLTPADLDAILRGGGSAADKLQRAATMALEKRAMTGPDVLTQEECSQILRGLGTAFEMFQKAARLGAQRERERAARALTSADSLAECVEQFQAAINTEAMARECAERDDADDTDHETLETAAENMSEAWKATDRAIHYYRKHAAAIRRGEGE